MNEGLNSVTHQATCDMCDHSNLIVGTRYKCAVCPDYDLCGGCFVRRSIHGQGRQPHDSAHAFYALDRCLPSNASHGPLGNRSGIVHHGFRCNVCKNRQDIVGTRYLCVQCQLNICEDCEFAGAHSPGHVRTKHAWPIGSNPDSAAQPQQQEQSNPFLSNPGKYERMARPENGRADFGKLSLENKGPKSLDSKDNSATSDIRRNEIAVRMARPENGRADFAPMVPPPPGGGPAGGMALPISGRNDFKPQTKRYTIT